ncbi:MAG: hypothetical protein A2X36_07255 [Elusimicrobia bacterium GWA2_69_24]|nr:MAG: hypothetical protein A2X36_07255 [Elusimicrobia bacterium GWA2_69_24]
MRRALSGLALVCLAAVPAGAAAAESLERLAGRVLLVGARGETAAGGDFERIVCGAGAGGVILFDTDVGENGTPRNILSQKQTARLTRDLQAMARRCGDAPLLIAADVEGGVVNRLRALPGLGDIRSARWLGKQDPERTRQEAERIARAMRAVGMNWDLAPVVDLDLNPRNPAIGRWGRAYSPDPNLVSQHAAAFIRGLRKRGVLNCIKHYPGEGSGVSDPHQGVADVSATADLEKELLPYRSLFAAKAPDCVMTAHLYHRTLDPKNIVSLSSAAITWMLRGELGYDGLVLSDDLQMGAATEKHTLEEAAVLALRAGTDMLTLSNNRGAYDFAAAERVRAAIVRAVQEGRLPRARLEAASRRILRLKDRIR